MEYRDFNQSSLNERWRSLRTDGERVSFLRDVGYSDQAAELIVRNRASKGESRVSREIQMKTYDELAQKRRENEYLDRAVARLTEFMTNGMSESEAMDAFYAEEARKRAEIRQQSLDLADDVAREGRQFSIGRAIRAQIDPQKYDAGFERAVSDAFAKQSGRDVRGIMLPLDLQMRTLSAGTATDGAELVATDLLGGRFIDVLRNRSVVMAAGAQMLPGLRGDVSIPRKTAASQAGWIATEGGDAPNSEPQFDNVTMTPKTVGSYAIYTRQLLLQSTPQIDGLLSADLAAGITTAIDVAGIEGDGTGGSPTGIVNASGISTQVVAADGSPTWAECVAFESTIDSDNALQGSTGWITTPTVRGNLKTTEKASNTAVYILGDGNTVAGHPLYATSNAATNRLLFGNFDDFLVGMWGGLDLIVDQYTQSTSGTVRVTALQSADMSVRHPESFCVGT